MIECRSRDEDYCCEFGFEIKEDNPCKLCPYIEKPKKDDSSCPLNLTIGMTTHAMYNYCMKECTKECTKRIRMSRY